MRKELSTVFSLLDEIITVVLRELANSGISLDSRNASARFFSHTAQNLMHVFFVLPHNVICHTVHWSITCGHALMCGRVPTIQKLVTKFSCFTSTTFIECVYWSSALGNSSSSELTGMGQSTLLVWKCRWHPCERVPGSGQISTTNLSWITLQL